MFLWAVLCFLAGIAAAVVGSSGGPAFLLPAAFLLFIAAIALLTGAQASNPHGGAMPPTM